LKAQTEDGSLTVIAAQTRHKATDRAQTAGRVAASVLLLSVLAPSTWAEDGAPKPGMKEQRAVKVVTPPEPKPTRPLSTTMTVEPDKVSRPATTDDAESVATMRATKAEDMSQRDEMAAPRLEQDKKEVKLSDPDVDAAFADEKGNRSQ
jgi:hypothetical protein